MSSQKKSEHLHLLVEPELIAKIDDYGFSNRIRTRAEIIRLLVRKGLDSSCPEKQKGEATA